MHNLAGLYAAGKGVPRDPAEAYVWVSLAVKYYPPDEPHRPGALVLQAALARTLAEDDLERAQKRVAAWQPKAEQHPPQS
jgi:TPR repeat protein